MMKSGDREHVASVAAQRALRYYDGSIPWRKYVAYITRVEVHFYWRKLKRRAETTMKDEWWSEEVYVLDDSPTLDISPEDNKLLHEYHVEKWCLDVVARRYGVSVYRARIMLREAEARAYEAAVEAGLIDPAKEQAEKPKGRAMQLVRRLSKSAARKRSGIPSAVARL